MYTGSLGDDGESSVLGYGLWLWVGKKGADFNLMVKWKRVVKR